MSSACSRRGAVKPLALLVVFVLLAAGFFLAQRMNWIGGPSSIAIERMPQTKLTGLEPRPTQAIRMAEGAVRQAPGSAEAWRQLGAMYDAHRMPDEAEVCYAASLELEPDQFWTRYQYAVIREMRGADTLGTIELYRELEAERDDLPQLALRIGGLLESLGELDEALLAYRRGVLAAPDFPIAQRMLGQALLALDQPAQALVHLERARELSPAPDGPTYSSLAQTYDRLGQVDKARELAAESELHKPTMVLLDSLRSEVTYLGVDSRTCFERAQFRMSARDYAGALQDLLIAAETMTTQPYVQLRLASCYAELDKAELASGRLGRALELRAAIAEGSDVDAPPSDLVGLDATISRFRMKYEQPSAVLEPFVARASQLASSGDFQATLDEFARAEASTLLTPRVRLAWARVAREHKDQYMALTQLEEVVRIDPGNFEAHLMRGELLESMNRTDEAVKSYRRALLIKPRHAIAERVTDLTGE